MKRLGAIIGTVNIVKFVRLIHFKGSAFRLLNKYRGDCQEFYTSKFNAVSNIVLLNKTLLAYTCVGHVHREASRGDFIHN